MVKRIIFILVVALVVPFSALAANNTPTYDKAVKQLKNRKQKARDQIRRDRKQYPGPDMCPRDGKQYPGPDIRPKDGKVIVPNKNKGKKADTTTKGDDAASKD